MTLDLNHLKKLAMAATPGPWVRAWREWTHEPHADVIGHGHVTVAGGTIYNNAADTEYIAAVNPIAILELIRLAEKASEPMLTTDDVPIEKRGKLCCVCWKIVPELEAEGHCAGHGK